MKAVAYTHCHPVDHPDVLLDLNLHEPHAPHGHDLLVEVRAVSVNPVDTKVRRNADPAGEPRVLGFDAAGVVRAVGPDVRLFHVGDEVFYAGAVNRPGSNAELQLVDERIVGRRPRTISFAESAALPLTSLTAYEALFERMGVPRGGREPVLVTGGAGGVGSVAIQLLRLLTDHTVITTASRPETRQWCENLGAHHVLDHSGDLAAQAKALGYPVRFVFSTTETPRNWVALTDLLTPGGTIGVIDDLHDADVTRLKSKSGRLAWEYMFTRAVHNTPDIAEQHRILGEVSRLVDEGRLRTTLGRHFGRINASNLQQAHAAVESGTMRGKAVLEGF
ncbi:zinc-binding alcohol dehydrogenase family protein [Roseomonas elaeocarpi]|uniref:Zinc-type alcohol dehydrogenase-like protein n=1 Tax=Roseomonas elaeocarpi TaxID=907779 RepID=A0ABV6JSS7_9PROT